MQSDAELLRRKAQQCRENAEKASTAEERAKWEEMARDLALLAQTLED